ncbi:pyridoxamine 5'-phosphate oxidase family protein [Sagittula sp. P11]|uniref:pyridoxamine 5'-phosphate oxidase family protein n=1 Tax=Sagittula sp. P11 TaxID=2009329 RepID=UPI0012FD28E0|nr:pyridoxamine 5'-phosphate oxidase family protein [Sagittula sp. P11]
MSSAYARIAFTSAVRAEQRRHGSDSLYAQAISDTPVPDARLGARETAFLQTRDGIFQATVSEDGWPYVQFRGGAPGFLKVIDPQTVAYADYTGNRQYISTGNLRGNDRVAITAMDFARAKRLKLLGRAAIGEDPALIAHLQGEGARRRRLSRRHHQLPHGRQRRVVDGRRRHPHRPRRLIPLPQTH